MLVYGNWQPRRFGPEVLSLPRAEVKDLDTTEYNALRKTTDKEKARVRKGYKRNSEKIKRLRQDYHAAVNRGTRSGSGKLVQDNFDLITRIWGGSPATTHSHLESMEIPLVKRQMLRIQRLKVHIYYCYNLWWYYNYQYLQYYQCYFNVVNFLLLFNLFFVYDLRGRSFVYSREVTVFNHLGARGDRY